MATDSDSDGWGCEFFYTEPTKEVPVKRYMHVRLRDCCMECVAPTPRVPEMVFPVTPRSTSDADELVPADEVINSMSLKTPRVPVESPRVPEMVFYVTPRNSDADELVKVPEMYSGVNSMSFTTPNSDDNELVPADVNCTSFKILRVPDELVNSNSDEVINPNGVGGSVCRTGCHGKDVDDKDNDNSAGQPITHQENPPQVSQ
jgi:hypothetical protein